jgi:hypothetical protein
MIIIMKLPQPDLPVNMDFAEWHPPADSPEEPPPDEIPPPIPEEDPPTPEEEPFPPESSPVRPGEKGSD